MGLGLKLKSARKRVGLTQQQVAAMLHIDKSTYCGYETEKRTPSLGQLGKIAQALQTTVYEMIGNDWRGIDMSDAFSNDIRFDPVEEDQTHDNYPNQKTQKSDPADLEIDEAALDEQLIRLLCQLSPEEQEKVDAFVQGMIAARPTAVSQEPKV